MVSNTILASLDICRLIGARDSGLISGGIDANGASIGPSATLGRSLSRALPLPDHPSRLAQFLFGDGAGGVDRRRPLEFPSSPWQVAALTQLHSLLDVKGRASNLAWLNLIWYSALSGWLFSAF